MTPILPDDHPSRMRRLELKSADRFFSASDRVLEIGGGNGFQAALLSHRVEFVVSIDIKPHPAPIVPVTIYDGRSMPFTEKIFDAIFSSNALEHIEDLDGILVESRRVLKDDGIAVHIVPTVAWRISTTFTHYPALPRIIWSNYRNLKSAKLESSNSGSIQANSNDGSQAGNSLLVRFRAKWIASILRSPRHGERGNALTEAYYYRHGWWRRRFENAGWEVLEDFPTGVYYTGNMLLGTVLPISWRRFLSHVVGSATRSYILKKRHDRPPLAGSAMTAGSSTKT
jgi:SAM-dependent methyltransferase